ncbi:MAG: MarR family winged helix-turn-helix transcriptional regulator [Nocardioidaceae bacterium]
MPSNWPPRSDDEGRRPLPPLLGELKELGIAEVFARLGDEGYPELRPGHGCVFRHMDRDGMRLTELAERGGLTKQAVGEVVDDLEQLGYVERVPDPADRRAKIIRLTEHGIEAGRAALRIFDDVERRWAATVGEERVAALRETVEALCAAERDAAAAGRSPAAAA